MGSFTTFFIFINFIAAFTNGFKLIARRDAAEYVESGNFNMAMVSLNDDGQLVLGGDNDPAEFHFTEEGELFIDSERRVMLMEGTDGAPRPSYAAFYRDPSNLLGRVRKEPEVFSIEHGVLICSNLIPFAKEIEDLDYATLHWGDPNAMSEDDILTFKHYDIIVV